MSHKKLTQRKVSEAGVIYRAVAPKAELAQKLGEIEYIGEGLANRICDEVCRYPESGETEGMLLAQCQQCPANKLAKLIGI